MKKFHWIHALPIGSEKNFIILLDTTQLPVVRVCGSLDPEGDLFHVLVTNPDTKEKLTIEELLSTKDAKEAVEKKLFDDGIIEDGDLVVDMTE